MRQLLSTPIIMCATNRDMNFGKTAYRFMENSLHFLIDRDCNYFKALLQQDISTLQCIIQDLALQ